MSNTAVLCTYMLCLHLVNRKENCPKCEHILKPYFTKVSFVYQSLSLRRPKMKNIFFLPASHHSKETFSNDVTHSL